MTTRRVRSLSVGDEMNKMENQPAPPAVTDNEIESTGRRALYGTLPFFSTFGMSSREMTLRDVISKASSNAKSIIGLVSHKKVCVSSTCLHAQSLILGSRTGGITSTR